MIIAGLASFVCIFQMNNPIIFKIAGWLWVATIPGAIMYSLSLPPSENVSNLALAGAHTFLLAALAATFFNGAYQIIDRQKRWFGRS
jgi:hypothetical protein